MMGQQNEGLVSTPPGSALKGARGLLFLLLGHHSLLHGLLLFALMLLALSALLTLHWSLQADTVSAVSILRKSRSCNILLPYGK